MSRRGVSDRAPKAQIRIIGTKVKGTKVGTMVTTTVRVIMSQMETTTATTTSMEVTIVTETIGMGPMSPQNREVTPRDGGDSMARVKDMLHKMMRRFDTINEHNE